MKRYSHLHDRPYAMPPSPVELRLAELPRGNGQWAGATHVWRKLQEAAHHLAKTNLCGADHVETMAILGCGHEETMKAHLAICYSNKWCQYDN